MEQNDNGYQPSDWRSLEMHRRIAERIKADPTLIELARSNISRWKGRRGTTSAYAEWDEILAAGTERVLRVITGEGQESARLRSSTPFTGILSEEERREIFDRWSARS